MSYRGSEKIPTNHTHEPRESQRSTTWQKSGGTSQMDTAAHHFSGWRPITRGGGQAGRGVGRASSCFSLVRKTPAFGCLSAPGDFMCLFSSVVRWAVRIAGHADRPAAPPDSSTAEGDTLWDHHRLLWQRKGNLSLSFFSLWWPYYGEGWFLPILCTPSVYMSGQLSLPILSLITWLHLLTTSIQASSLFTWMLNGF